MGDGLFFMTKFALLKIIMIDTHAHIYSSKFDADRDQVIQYYSTNNQARASVESLVMEDQVVDWILGQVIKKESKESFDNIVKQRQ